MKLLIAPPHSIISRGCEMVMPFIQEDQSAKNNSRPLVIAHRGASGLAPENTLAAIKLALALGADGVEMDAQLSADRRAVVIHDARVNRTTNGAGAVCNFTADELSRLDAGEWFVRRLSTRPRARAMVNRAAQVCGDEFSFAREPVPTLEDALAFLARGKPRRIYIELKGRRENKTALLENIIDLVREFRLEDSATLLSFDNEIVKRAKESAPEIRTAATFSIARGRSLTTRSIIRSLEESCADEAALHFGLVTRRVVDALHERGLSVSAWTANSKFIMRRLAACGVDSIMTNFPNRLNDALASPRRFAFNRNGKNGASKNWWSE